ncbi:MAG: hypothetical protein QOK33_2624 [Mycobacterium sp.]|jgi:hypothetical protein|nr:hypothetical protein [Mycobacterium sp.]MDT5399393.1 hypothetical protein [Mycobacterium sp.]
MTDALTVVENGRTLRFTFDDVMRYHGPGSPGGVAVAFKALQRAFDLLSPGTPPERRSVTVRTAFRGPGARDCFEAVTRAVTDGRFTVDRTLLRTDRGRLLEDFVFEIGLDAAAVTLLLRDGFVDDEFIDLARAERRTEAQELRLDALKAKLAQRVMAASADRVFSFE